MYVLERYPEMFQGTSGNCVNRPITFMYLQVLVSFKDYFNGTIYNIKEMVGGL
jgi:hypothetical protein